MGEPAIFNTEFRNEPLLETPDFPAPQLQEELEEDLEEELEPPFESEFDPEAGDFAEPDNFALEPPPRAHSALARALAVAVDVEEACEANDNVEEALAPPDAFAPAHPVAPSQTRRPAVVATVEEEEPPFDAPDADDDIFRPPAPPRARRWSDPADVLELHTPAPPSFPHEPDEIRPPARPRPAINIHVSWDRAPGADLAEQLAADPLLERCDISDAPGGVGGAAAYLAKINAPDLLILETTLKAGALLEAVDALGASLSPITRLFIVGDVNDVTLLRELARRGVMHYFLAPSNGAEITRSICDLHAEIDKSRVIAIVGARGGAGASTVAHNLAWSLAERHDASTTLIELDIAFGATAFAFDQRPAHSLAEGVRDPQCIDESFVERVGAMQTERLRLIAAPALLGEDLKLERTSVGALIRNARRMSKVVVLDVPHCWDACIKDVLERANDIVIVAPPDPASLRNTKGLLDALRPPRPAGPEPMVALSMVGASKATEISEKDFAGAVGAHPIMALAFDPALFVGAAIKRQMLGESAPQSPPARQIDDLAELITGRKLVKRRKSARNAQTELARIDARRAQSATPKSAPLGAPNVETLNAETLDQEIFELIEAVSSIKDHREAEAPLVSEAASVMEPPAPKEPAPRRQRPRPVARTRPRRIESRGQPGTLRLTFALMALLAASMWYVEKRADVDFIAYAIGSGR